jgi:hypothetical protein
MPGREGGLLSAMQWDHRAGISFAAQLYHTYLWISFAAQLQKNVCPATLTYLWNHIVYYKRTLDRRRLVRLLSFLLSDQGGYQTSVWSPLWTASRKLCLYDRVFFWNWKLKRNGTLFQRTVYRREYKKKMLHPCHFWKRQNSKAFRIQFAETCPNSDFPPIWCGVRVALWV